MHIHRNLCTYTYMHTDATHAKADTTLNLPLVRLAHGGELLKIALDGAYGDISVL